MSNPILKVDGLGKRYAEYSSELKRIATWFGASFAPSREHWAVRDISFSVRAGEALAIIGQNGAGKSSLLKIITGTVRPTTGQVAVGGRISAILELGLGFNPELTGRENVRHAGGLMGFAGSEIARLMPEIEAFAEIGDFFDQPLRTYSSGMSARLAFALATAVRPEILIVDEVLSVGDSYFQHKSFSRIREFKEQGTSILLVTHALGDVRALCDRVILLDKGRILRDGAPDEVVDYYHAMNMERENAKLTVEQRRSKGGWLHTEYGDRSAVMEAVDLVDATTGQPVSTVRVGDDLEIRSTIVVNSNIERLVVGHRICDRTGHIVWGTNTWHTQQIVHGAKAGQRISSVLRFRCMLGPGSYSISFGLHQDDTHYIACHHKADNHIVFDVVNTDRFYFIGSTCLDAHFELQVMP